MILKHLGYLLNSNTHTTVGNELIFTSYWGYDWLLWPTLYYRSLWREDSVTVAVEVVVGVMFAVKITLLLVDPSRKSSITLIALIKANRKVIWYRLVRPWLLI